MIARMRTPSSWTNFLFTGQRESEKEGGREREKEGGGREIGLFFIRNDGCLGTF